VKQQLVFVEGIPGSGKTTTASWLAGELRARGRPATAYLEMDEAHPLHAFWTWGDGYNEGEVVTEPYAPDKFTDRLNENAGAFVRRVIARAESAVVDAYPFQLAVRNDFALNDPRSNAEANLGTAPSILKGRNFATEIVTGEYTATPGRQRAHQAAPVAAG
jgi:hypothetical protein